MPSDLQREIDYHEKLYSGFAQSHFAKPAVRALRRHMVQRILKQTGAGKSSRVLSLGCGIGDTELLLAPHVADLTPREHQVLTLITRGKSNRDIATELNIAEKTVRIHVSSVLDKLNARDRTQAAIYAIQQGIVHLP